MRLRTIGFCIVALVGCLASDARVQERPSESRARVDRKQDDPARQPSPRAAGGPNDFMPPPFGGPGGPMGQQQKLIEKFDSDGDGKLDRKERDEAREFLKKNRPQRNRRFGPPGAGSPPGEPRANDGKSKSDGARRAEKAPGRDIDFGPPPGFGPPGGGIGGPGPFGRRNAEKPKPGKKLAPADVAQFPDASLYDPSVIRTIFIDFADKDWESELADFYRTDVEIPAKLTVDGKVYPNVGVHFRGASSYFTVPEGYKRSLNLTMDFVDSKQRLYGYKTLNLLNSHEDDSFLSSVLYSHIARRYLAAPKANFVRVVINGESWGLYVNVQQFNKEFLQENFKSTKGARWKVKGSPGGGGGLDYVGDGVDAYRRRYEIKSGDNAKSWKALIELCRTLTQTPASELKQAIEPQLDVDSALWFLALDIALINCDGYWIRASDYNLYRDEKGKFHVVPHDMNEAFRLPMGPGMGGPGGPGGPGGRGFAKNDRGGEPSRPRGDAESKRKADEWLRPGFPRKPPSLELDPMQGLDDPRKPLRSKLLQVPEYRKKYLANLRTIAEQSLDWQKIGPSIANFRKAIEPEIEADTRKLSSIEAFRKAVADQAENAASAGRRPPTINLRTFFEKRRAYLLNYLNALEAKDKNA